MEKQKKGKGARMYHYEYMLAGPQDPHMKAEHVILNLSEQGNLSLMLGHKI